MITPTLHASGPSQTPNPADSSAQWDETPSLSLSFGKYRLTRLLARGGMGEVYLARLVGELGFEKRLVIKTILPHLAAKPRFVELFAAEAKTAVALSHGNIVPIYELGRTGDTFYIVMGHVDGPNLETLLHACEHDGAPLEVGAALHIMRGVLSGLAYAHHPEPGRHAVVHRDITPRNVLIDRSGQVRIVDFGIAAPADAEVEMRAGSTGYAAPEQFRGEPVDPRADVFSAGCLLYELVTSRRAFPKEGVWVDPPMDEVPLELRDPLRAALQLDARDRPADAAALLQGLGPAFAAYGASYTDRQLAALLRQRFPEGWGTDGPRTRVPRPQGRGKADDGAPIETFATRLTIITNPGLVRPPPRRRRRWWVTGAAAFAMASGTAWGLLAAQENQGAPGVDGAPAKVLAPPLVAATEANRPPDPPPDSGLAVRQQTASNEGTAPLKAAPALRAARFALTGPGGELARAESVPETFSVALDPPDATVSIDGQRIDDTARVPVPATGATMIVRHRGYISQTFTLDAEHPPPTRVTLRPISPEAPGFVQVFASDVPWAEVTIDGRPVATTPTRKLAVPPGEHRVVVACVPDVCPSRRTLSATTVRVRSNDTVRVHADAR